MAHPHQEFPGVLPHWEKYKVGRKCLSACMYIFPRDSSGQALKPIWRSVLKCYGSGERIRGTKGRFVKK